MRHGDFMVECKKDPNILNLLSDGTSSAVAMSVEDRSDDRPVNIDWLAFVMHSSAVKDFVTFPEQTEWRKYAIHPTYRNHVSARDTFFNDVINPKTRMWCPLTDADIEEKFDEFVDGYEFPLADFGGDYRKARNAFDAQLDNFNKKVMDARVEMIRRWLAAEFGLHLGVFRGYGRFLYQDSAPLYAYNDDKRTELGFLYVGGNEGTVFIQINAHGCKHVFSGTSPEHLYKWFTHLGISTINRLDLCVDDFDGVFTVHHAYQDFKNDAFYRGRGRRSSSYTYTIGDVEMLTIGSRQSSMFWRIYNKAMEQGIDNVWNRSEVELKQVPVEVLLDISGYFTGFCDYASQLNPSKPRQINPFNPSLSDLRKAIHSFESDVKWLRTQCSKKIAAVIHQLGYDFEALFSTIVRREHIEDESIRFATNDCYQQIVRNQFKNRSVPF